MQQAKFREYLVPSRWRPRKRKKIYFMHLPKCGGTSFTHALTRHYAPNAIFSLEAKAMHAAAKQTEYDIKHYSNTLLAYALNCSGIELIVGHLGYSPMFRKPEFSEWDFVTILRHPVARWFSHYFFNHADPGNHFYIKESLEDFVDTDRAKRLGNLYLAHLCKNYEPGSDLPSAVSEAVEVLSDFSFVGKLEDQSELEYQFKTRFDIPLKLGRKNSNPISPEIRRKQISPQLVKKVTQICAPDLMLYERFFGRSE